ncbi:MAG: HAD family phosphatase [Candidatus Bathyarchaeota archaeon]|nr:HAD family phosphatase [Candidatus Bathyarchaeota archaeon]
MPDLAMFEAVIFDWDGTLADTRKVIVASFHGALKEINLDVTDEYIERRIGIGAAETFRDVLRSAKRQFDEALVERLVERKSLLEVELTPQVRLFEGSRELLETLRGKVKLGLASMNNRSVITSMLKFMAIDGCFDVVLTAESISHSKPDPEIFLKTAEQLHTRAHSCVVLEDSLFGVAAAKAARMGCIAVTTGVYSKDELKEKNPDLIVETLSDPRIIPFILG